MQGRPPLALALAFVPLIAVAGCGSSGPSRAQFLTRANAICRQVNNRVSAQGQAKTAGDVKRMGPAILVIEHRGLSQLRALAVPAALASDWRLIMRDLGQLTDNVARLVTAASLLDTPAAQQAATDSERIQTQISRVAGRDGLKECAKG